jgi:Flp pilus assembly protein TadG
MKSLTPRWWSATRRAWCLILEPSPAVTNLVRAREATTAVEFAICALAMMLIVVGFVEFGRLVWSFEVLQEVAAEGARCMGLGASSCASAGAYSSANTRTYVVNLASSRGVVITAAAVSLNNAAICGGAGGFSQVSINYDFTTVAPALVTSLANGFTVPASACFPNHS